MTKTQRDSIIAVVMVVLFIGAAIRTAKLAKNHAPKPAAVEATSSVETQLLDDAKFINSVRATKRVGDEQSGRWDQDWERDPFRAEEAAAAGGIENLVLHGVFWEEQSPRAVVNNKILHIGEAIDGYKIMEIRPRSVVLWTGEKNLELTVFGSPFVPSTGPDGPAHKTPPPPVQSEAQTAPPEETAPKNESIFAKLPMTKELDKKLQVVNTFATDTSGAEAMMKMMGGDGKLIPVKQKPKEGS